MVFTTLIFNILICCILGIIPSCVLLKLLTSPFPTLRRSKKEEEYLELSSNTRQKFPSIEDPQTVHLSVVIPAYNEQSRLPSMLNECISVLKARCQQNEMFTYEIIIVNDGSTDQTSSVALEYSKKEGANRVRLLQLETNRGKGGAVKLGVESARGAVILFADADGATKFADIAKLEGELERLVRVNYVDDPESVAAESVIICGSRAHLEEQAIAERSLARNFLMHGFHFLVWLLAVRSLRDTQCGFKLLTRSAAKLCFKSLHVTRWAFDVELLYIAECLNVRLSEVAVRWTEIEGSKLVPVWSWLQMGSDLVLIWLKYLIGAWKLKP